MSLGEKLRKAMERLRNSTTVDKETVKEVVKELQRALISADVEIGTVLELSKKIEEDAFKDLKPGMNRKEHVIKASYDALVEILGGSETQALEKPDKILMIGLYGSGKTTSCAKIAKYYSKRGLKPGMICADTARPAAFEQLKQLSEKTSAEFYGDLKEKNAARITEKGLKELESKKCGLIIVDSAGRSALDEELVKEIKEVQKTLNAEHVWLVIGADIGQLAKKQAKAFHEAVKINGIVISRMDGSAKGGGALAACKATNARVFFIGTGEKLEDLEVFDANRFLSRIMGYGDLQGLLEKAREVQEEIPLSPEELLEGEFTFKTFYEQLKATRKMGPLNKVAEMMGLGMQLPKDLLETSEQKLDSFKVMMDSMTKAEMQNPEVLNKSRILRVAKGSGKKEEEVRELIKQFKRMKSVFKKFKEFGEVKDLKDLQKKGKLQKLLQGFQKKKKLKFR